MRCLLLVLVAALACLGCPENPSDQAEAREVANAFFLALREKLHKQAQHFFAPNTPWGEMSEGQFLTFFKAAEEAGALDFSFEITPSASDNHRARIHVFTVTRTWKDLEVLSRAARSPIGLHETFFAQPQVDCTVETRDGRWKITGIQPTREFALYPKE